VPPDPRVTGEEARRRAGIAHARAPSTPRARLVGWPGPAWD
jgi:hypothetical protein